MALLPINALVAETFRFLRQILRQQVAAEAASGFVAVAGTGFDPELPAPGNFDVLVVRRDRRRVGPSAEETQRKSVQIIRHFFSI